MGFSVGAQAADQARIHFVDVGYGDAIILQPATTKACLIDTGTSSHAGSFIEYLRSNNIEDISWVLITHGHKNHFGGLKEAVNNFSIPHVYIGPDERGDQGYQELLEWTRQQGITVKLVDQGDVLSCGKVSVTVLYPDRKALAGKSINANSVVSLLRYQGLTVFLTSDVPPAIQQQLMDRYDALKATALIQIPHHGGHLSESFIKTFKGRTFFLSTGDNPWSLPYEDINKLQGRIYRTDQDGAIVVELGDNAFTVETKQ